MGIRVNNVCPGTISTERQKELVMAQSAREGKDPEVIKEYLLKGIPSGRFGTPEDLGIPHSIPFFPKGVLHYRADYNGGRWIHIPDMILSEPYDVVVVGAGIVCLSSAYHLKKINPDIKILIVEKGVTYAQGNTTRTTGGFRDLYSSEVNYNLASSSIAFYSHVQRTMNYNMGMHFVGYLFLLSEKQLSMGGLGKMEKRGGARFLELDEIESLISLNRNPDPYVSAMMGLESVSWAFMGKNCGVFESDLICNFYYKNLKRMGVEFLFGTEVNALNLVSVNPIDYPGEPFLWQDKKISSISTSKGTI